MGHKGDKNMINNNFVKKQTFKSWEEIYCTDTVSVTYYALKNCKQ